MQDIDLTKRPTSRNELADWYAAALADHASSGLSLSEYASELGVVPATLYQWRRRLSVEAAAEFETPASLGLVEVSIEERPPSAPSDAIIVRLGHGRCVEVPKRFDDNDLIRLIEILESC